MSQNAREIAERMLITHTNRGYYWEDEIVKLARAYLELEKKERLPEFMIKAEKASEIAELHLEIEKLKEHNQRLKTKIVELKSELLIYTGDDI